MADIEKALQIFWFYKESFREYHTFSTKWAINKDTMSKDEQQALVKTRKVIAKKLKHAQMERAKQESANDETFTPVSDTTVQIMDQDGAGGSGGDDEVSQTESLAANDYKNNPEMSKKAKKLSITRKAQGKTVSFPKSSVIKRKRRYIPPSTTPNRVEEKSFIPYNSNIVYEYYDDPNELCDRLKLLVSSQIAGNSNHNQEINSILEELHERNIIL